MTVTELPLALAATPAAAQPAVLIVVARFVARVDVLGLAMKVPLKFGAEPLHVVEPLLPAVVAPQAKPVTMFSPTENVLVPNVVEVAVTVLVLATAVVPTVGKPLLQLLIASLTFEAKVAVVLLVTKVPAVELVHPLVVPFVPAVTPLHE